MSEPQACEARDEQPRRIFYVGGEHDDTEAIQAALDGVGFWPGGSSSIDGPQVHKLFS